MKEAEMATNTQTSTEDHNQADAVFQALLEAQTGFACTESRHMAARRVRDEAILNASRWGFTRRTVAQATDMTVGRVQQIIDEHGGVVANPGLLPSGKRWRYPIGDPRRLR
jgi:hypothetical protein